MDVPEGWSQSCICGRVFSSPQGYRLHHNSCANSKKRLGGALNQAREVQAIKKRRIADAKLIPPETTGLLPHITCAELPLNDLPLPGTQPQPAGETNYEDLDQSLAERRTRRRYRQLPKRYRDIAPDVPAALPPSLHIMPASTQAESDMPGPSPVRKILKSSRNKFGLFRQYYATRFPDHDPSAHITLNDLHTSTSLVYDYSPYPNLSTFLLGEWYWNGGEKKSQSSFQNLVKIVGHPEFHPEDVAAQNWRFIDARLSGESNGSNKEDDWMDEDSSSRLGVWTQTPIRINAPFHKGTLRKCPTEFEAGILHHRKLMSIIKERISRPSVHPHLHFEPYELFWQPNDATEPVRVHGELYTSEAFIEAHKHLQDSPPEKDCDLPRVVLGLMFSSDGTQLTSFSTAKLWPVYLLIGNESKDRRSKPSCQAFEHLPDAFTAFAAENFGKEKKPSDAFTGHCNREMYHAQWSIILDDEFLQAYKHGMVIKCCDNNSRRFYPRVFTYSADYKEKIIIVGLRNLGNCPCPRCLIPMDRVHNMGMRRDMLQRVSLSRVDDLNRRHRVEAAREAIYKQNHGVNGKAVENLLKVDSMVPAANAFSEKLSLLGFNMFEMLVVDLMHEIEIGVWKMTFIHLLRLLECLHDNLKPELDRRFREVPPFGVDGVRKITTNRSELKKMTAHDYEDMLQCAIPVFDGLLPEPHNTRVLKLLFNLAHWHGLAKLRMHTEATLELLSQATVAFGNGIREFQEKTCSVYATHELERERVARMRRQEKNTAAAGASNPGSQKRNNGKQTKEFNLKTYKFHSLGDYCSTIRRFGTTDSYSTQPSEREHRTSKGRFLRTSGRLIPQQLSKIEQRQRHIRHIRENLNIISPSQREPEVVAVNHGAHYTMGTSQKFPVHVATFLRRNEGDPAIKDFFPKLRNHLLPRIQAALQKEAESRPKLACNGIAPNTGLPPSLDHGASHFVLFKNESIYRHKVIRFNFTTYDMRRGTDIINPETSRRNIMLLADSAHGSDPPDLHHFLYARVLGVYHANVIYTGPGMQDYEARSFNFLWVRWFVLIDPGSSGWANSTLDSVRFPPLREDDSFGFVDPDDVLRACHIIPAFAKGQRKELMRDVSRWAKDSKDYLSYCIGRFSDRDLLMRYHWGQGIGHLHAHQSASSCIPDQSPEKVTAIDPLDDDPDPEELPGGEDSDTHATDNDLDNDHELNNPEFTLEDRDPEGWEDVESDAAGDPVAHDPESEDDDRDIYN